MRKLPLLIIFGTIVAAGLVGVGTFYALRHEDPPATHQPAPVQTATPESSQPAPNTTKKSDPTPKTSPDKPNYSLTDPASLWMIVNKQRPLPSSYAPSELTSVGGYQLRREAATAATALMADAANDGVSVRVISGYRSYAYQQNLYAGYVRQHGQAEADTFSARAGHSEHQTGLAADFGNSGNCDLETCFATTAAGKWLAAHAHEHGFIIRYAETTSSITGYQYEPWHLRYVGNWLANEIHTTPRPLETYFKLGAAPDYN